MLHDHSTPFFCVCAWVCVLKDTNAFHRERNQCICNMEQCNETNVNIGSRVLEALLFTEDCAIHVKSFRSSIRGTCNPQGQDQSVCTCVCAVPDHVVEKPGCLRVVDFGTQQQDLTMHTFHGLHIPLASRWSGPCYCP